MASAEYHRNYYKRNRETIKQRSAKRYEDNSDDILRAERQKRRDDPEGFREKARGWYWNDPEQKRATASGCYQRRKVTNPEGLRQSRRRWRAENLEKARQCSRDWAARNPAKVLAATQRSRALRAAAPGTFTVEQLLAKYAFHGWRCYLCHIPITLKTSHPDHRKPLSRGGSNWIANIAPACISCNLRKNNKTEAEFRSGP
jgi:5-methylcytosine-specific restriction endonuclease McrA